MLWIKFIFFLLIININYCRSNNKYICGDNNVNNNNIELSRTQEFFICIHFKSIGLKTSFNIELDKEKIFTFKNIYDKLKNKEISNIKNKNEMIIIQTELKNDILLTIPYIKENSVYDFWSVILIFKNGNLILISADVGCWYCEEKFCDKNINISDENNNQKNFDYCRSNYEELKINSKLVKSNEKNILDSKDTENKKNVLFGNNLKIQFTFIGTDKDGRKLISGGDRIKNYNMKNTVDILRKHNYPHENSKKIKESVQTIVNI